MNDLEICPICREPFSKNNMKVHYHLEYGMQPKYIFACKACNYAEYLSRHWKKHLKPMQWRRIQLVRKFAKENPHLHQ